MKLIRCSACGDVYNVTFEKKYCHCGRTSAQYDEDGLYAVYSGETAVPIGFSNESLIKAMQQRPEKGAGKTFIAFVIPKECPTFRKVGE